MRQGPGGAAGILRAGEPDTIAAPRTKHEPLLVCAACRARVTTPADGIEVNGAHSHAFVNPAGILYRVRCFRAAPGVAGLGEQSGYWTWFPGFRWQTCICRACFEHLGWRFQSTAASFFALITERLLELQEPPEPGASN